MSDYILRAIDVDSEIRAFAVITTESCQAAQKIHELSALIAVNMNKLLTVAAVMHMMEKNDDAVISLQLSGIKNKLSLNAIASADGDLKCCVVSDAMDEKNLQAELKEGFLKLVRDTGMREPYISAVKIKNNNLVTAVQDYYAQSEQVDSYVAFTDTNDDCQMGIIAQILPNSKVETVKKFKKKFTELNWHSITSPEILLEKLDMKIIDKQMVQYKCSCSRERMEKALISLGKNQLQSLIDDGEPLEMGCRFCKKTYSFTIAELRKLVV